MIQIIQTRIRFLLGILLLLTSTISFACVDFRTLNPSPIVIPSRRIVVLGDSIAVGFGLQPKDTWVSLLSEQLVKEKHFFYRVINSSTNARTARDLAASAYQILQKNQPDIVIIEIGGNDGLRRYPVSQIEKNISRIIELAKQKNAKVLLLGFQLPLNYPEDYRSDFYAMYQRLQKAHQIVLVDFFFEHIVNQPGMFQGDGIHPTEKAQPLLLEAVWPVLKPML